MTHQPSLATGRGVWGYGATYWYSITRTTQKSLVTKPVSYKHILFVWSIQPSKTVYTGQGLIVIHCLQLEGAGIGGVTIIKYR